MFVAAGGVSAEAAVGGLDISSHSHIRNRTRLIPLLLLFLLDCVCWIQDCGIRGELFDWRHAALGAKQEKQSYSYVPPKPLSRLITLQEKPPTYALLFAVLAVALFWTLHCNKQGLVTGATARVTEHSSSAYRSVSLALISGELITDSNDASKQAPL